VKITGVNSVSESEYISFHLVPRLCIVFVLIVYRQTLSDDSLGFWIDFGLVFGPDFCDDMRNTSAAASQCADACKNLLDHACLGIGVILNLIPLLPGESQLVRAYRSRSAALVRSRSRNSSIRSISGQPAESMCRLMWVSGPRNRRCSCQSGSRNRSESPRPLTQDVVDLIGRVSNYQKDVNDWLGYQARYRRRSGMLDPQRLVSERGTDSVSFAPKQFWPVRIVFGD
jgi:hypothetical protein